MAVYLVGLLNIRNTDWLEKYQAPTAALIAKHGGRYLAAGGAMEQVEGDSLPSATVLLEFPTKEAALAWYNDPEYAPLIELRRTGSDGNVFFVEGVE